MRYFFISFAMAMVLLSCNHQQHTNANYVALAKKMFDAFNQHQWQAMANCYSDSALFLDPSFGKTYQTQARTEIVEKYAGFQQAFPDLHDELVDMYPSDNKVIVEFISTGRAPDGTSFKLPIITVLTFENDLIVKDATYYDVENP
jgi:ketosteroid isomerase-like protein